MVCQKVCKQGRDNTIQTKVNIKGMSHPYIMLVVVYLITLAEYFYDKKQTFRHLCKCLLQCK